LDAKLNVALVLLVTAGGASASAVVGGVESSIAHVYVTAGSSTMSNALVPWIVNSCSPAARCG
jgi:hypothetical protein